MAKTFLERDPEAPSVRQEKRIAKGLHGRRQVASGAFPCHRGDVKLQDFLVEAKTTGHKSYRLSLDTLEKIDREALGSGRRPMMVIEFDNAPGGVPKEWAVIPYSVLQRILRGETL